MKNPPQQSASTLVWWVLGMDTGGVWHERRMLADSEAQIVAWWKDRAGREPDICWKAEDALAHIQDGLSRLHLWPTLPGSQVDWFLGWMGSREAGKMGLVAVPAVDATHAMWILSNERPDCIVRILGQAGTLSVVSASLVYAIARAPGAIDEDLRPRAVQAMPQDISLWLAAQFEVEASHG